MKTVLIITVWILSVAVLQAGAQAVVSLPSIDNSTGELLTLESYLCGRGENSSQLQSNTILELSQDSPHYFNTSGFCIVSSISNITIRGRYPSSQPSLVVCNDDTSSRTQTVFVFENLTDVVIENVYFQRCGGIVPSSIKELFATTLTTGAHQQAMLFLVSCFNIELRNLSITEYFGYGVYAVNVLGKFEMNSIQVSRSDSKINNLTETTGNFSQSGSGVFVVYTETRDSNTPNDTTLTIIGANLTANTNLFPNEILENISFSAIEFTYRQVPLILPGAGGLTIIFAKQSYLVKTILNDSRIVDNAGTLMGGILIGHLQNIGLTRIHINNCVFAENLVFPNDLFLFAGAALQIVYIFPPLRRTLQQLTDAAFDNEQIHITNSSFIANTGNSGSAINVYSGAQNLRLHNVTFESNLARVTGECMYVYSDKSIRYSQNEIFVFMDHITFNGAETDVQHGTTSVFSFFNIGAVVISGSVEQPSVFRNATHSVIRAFATNIHIRGTVIFQDISAVVGTAIYLIANSYLFFQEPTDVQFINNHVTLFGGAIYTEALSSDQCAVQFLSPNKSRVLLDTADLSSLDINLSFENNTAIIGSSVYAGPIYNCSWFIESAVQSPRETTEEVYKHFFDFPQQNETFANQVRSYPQAPCYCSTEDDGEIMCIENQNHTSIETFPGRSFNVTFVPVDAAKRPVTSLVITQLLGKNDVAFAGNAKAIPTWLGGDKCGNQTYTLFNQENITVRLQIGVPDSSGFINASVALLPCPNGFELYPLSGICDCSPLYRDLELFCDIQTGFIERNDAQWLGLAFVNTTPTPAYAIRCPTDYCDKSVIDIDLTVDDFLCKKGRRGAICGQCQRGLSVMFGTVECGDCSHFWLFTILLYMLAGILLVFLLFLLQLTISEGTIIGLVFYAQAVSINDGLLLLTDRSTVLTVFISFLNLDLGFPLCFYDGMDLTAKVGLQFVFPVYIWLIVIIIIQLGRFSKHFQEMTGQSAVHVLVTLMYLTFTKLLRSVVIIFIATELTTEGVESPTRVWFFDGSITYFYNRHLFLGILGIVTLIGFIIPYKTFLLLVQWLSRVPKINYLKPLIDANIAAFKDEYRFWFGLRLFVIGIKVILTVALTAHYPESVLFVHLLINFPYTVVQAYLLPFRTTFLNILDLFFLVNYTTFLFTHLYLTGAPHITTDNFYSNFLPAEIIFVGSALLVFIGIVVYHIWFYTVPRFKKLRSMHTAKVDLNEVTTSEIALEESQASELPRAQTQTTDINDFWAAGHRLRESLLED